VSAKLVGSRILTSLLGQYTGNRMVEAGLRQFTMRKRFE